MGWIKLEKDLLTDPRLVRLAQCLSGAVQMRCQEEAQEAWPGCNGQPLPGVTLVLGALAHLWMIADTHIGDDNVLPLGVDEIDQLLGLPGFTEMLPQDWLQILDKDRVKLPGYHTHNGTTAKERALNQKRVAKSRYKSKHTTISQSNGKSLPDQDQDQDQDHRKSGERASAPATRLPEDFRLTPERRAIAAGEHIDAEREFAKFTDHWRSQPGAKGRKLDWDATWRNWCRSDIAARAAKAQPTLTWRPPADDGDAPH